MATKKRMFIPFLLIPPFHLVVLAQTITQMTLLNFVATHMFQTYQVPYQLHPAPARPQLLILEVIPKMLKDTAELAIIMGITVG